ncbi:MAG: hypothetical protein ACJ76N_31535 [Thermoanaerobaculia bacterium]
MSSKTARRTAAALLAAALLAPPVRADRNALRAEIDRTRAEIGRSTEGLFHNYGNPETVRALGRFWALIQAWTGEYLDAHPRASAREIEADLAALASQGDLRPSAVRLTGDAAVIAIDWGFHGTVFVLSRTPPQPYKVAWDLRAVAEKSPPDSALAAWAATVPGVHGGPLGGSVLALPPARSGRPRFLTDAIEHAGMGLSVPGQIGVWEWTGKKAVPEFLQGYSTTGGLAKLQGDRVLIPTKEITRMFYTCGSCEDPEGTWTLRVTPDGLTDLGHSFADPLMPFIDDLLDRVAHHRDATALASRSASARLAKILAELREEEKPEDDLGLGMLMGWKVRGHGNHRTVDLETDWGHLLFTVGRRAGKPYVTAVEEPVE